MRIGYPISIRVIEDVFRVKYFLWDYEGMEINFNWQIIIGNNLKFNFICIYFFKRRESKNVYRVSIEYP